MSDVLVCIGCGRERPNEEDIQLSREGLGDPFSPFCWGGIEGRPPCRVSSAPDGRQYITLIESGDVATLARLVGHVEERLWPGDPPDSHPDEVRVRILRGDDSPLMLSVDVWDALSPERQVTLEAYVRGFMDGAWRSSH